MNILLGDISSYKAITVAKFIHDNYPDIRIFSFDSRKFTNTFCTKYVYKNFILEGENLESYVDLINTYKINFFIPVINDSLGNFWKNKVIFNNTLNYLGSFSSYQILNDKSQLHNLAESLNILIPKKYPNIRSAILPFVIKPTNLSSAKGVIYVNEKSDIPTDFIPDNMIVQQFVKGIGVGYSFYCKNGIILNGYGHKRLAEYPVSGGSSTYRTEHKDRRMYEVSSKVVRELNYTGFAMFEFKLTPKNELFLLEVNPRIWGSINQGMVNGINYFEGFLGKPKESIETNNVSFNTYLGPLIYISLFKYLLRFDFGPIKYFLKNIKRNIPDVSIIHDPKGYLSTILRKVLS